MTDDREREELGSEVGMLPPTRREWGKIENRNLWAVKIATDTHRRTRTLFVKIVSMVEMVWNVKNIMFVSNLLIET